MTYNEIVSYIESTWAGNSSKSALINLAEFKAEAEKVGYGRKFCILFWVHEDRNPGKPVTRRIKEQHFDPTGNPITKDEWYKLQGRRPPSAYFVPDDDE